MNGKSENVDLREKARRRLNSKGPSSEISTKDNITLIEELTLHQEELNIQNEELRRIQIELEASRAKYFELYDLAPVGYITLTSDLIINEANLTSSKLLGVGRKELINRPLSQFISSQSQESFYLHYRRFAQKQEERLDTFTVQRKDGKVMQVQFKSNLVEGGIGKGFRSILTDVTELMLKEQELKESEAKYRNLFDSTTEAIAIEEPIYDQDGVALDYYLRDVNPTWERMFSKNREEVVGRTAKAVFGEIEWQWLDMFARVVDTGEPSLMETYSAIIGRHYNINSWKISDRTVASGIIDITDIKRAQRQADEGHARLQASVETVPIGFLIYDADGKPLLYNDELKRIWAIDMPLEEMAESFDRHGFWPEAGGELKAEDWPEQQALLFDRETRNVVVEIQRLDGKRRIVAFSGSPIKDGGGNKIGAVVAMQDITDQKVLELNLKRSNAELQQFAYVASHDLQEPLRMIGGYLGLLNKKYGNELGPQARAYLSAAVNGADRMRHLIDDLLQYSRIDAQLVKPTLVDLTAVAERAKDNLQIVINEAKAQVIIEALPTVLADEGQVYLAFQNLLTNAIKFRSEKPPKINVFAQHSNNEWVIAVRDNGIGIDPENNPNMFKMFQRFHSREEYPGTGIGLAIVKKIVERQGGHIWFESEPMKGSTFYFSIPERNV
mgnify:FL=1|jgi:PAS domain S-box-containing protein